jgi:hypothetical protein
MPSEVVRAREHDRERSLGWLAVEWIEHFCIHGPGDISGTPLSGPGAIPLSDELAKFTADCYALGADGRRLYDSAFYSRPKGMNKSGYAAWIACFEALGPCRFDGWAEGGEVFEWLDFRHVYEPGEPMGRRVTYPYLRILATEEDQAGNVYDAVYENLRNGPLREAFRRQDDVGLTRVFLPGGGELVPCTSGSASKDGGRESWVSFDETHLYITPELRRMYATVRRNLTKRKQSEPWSLETSTMYQPGQAAAAEGSHLLARSIREGKEKHARFLFDHREAPWPVDLEDATSVMVALREAYGNADYIDYDRKLAEIMDPRNARSDSVRFSFNIAMADAGRAFDIEKWRSTKRPNEVKKDALITLGFDGSVVRDATALVATHVATGYQWPLGIWERPERVAEWHVDKVAVKAAVDEAFARFHVWRMYADPSKWEDELAGWSGRYGEKVVLAFPPGLVKRMCLALKAYGTAIENGQVPNDGDVVMERHLANAMRDPQHFLDDDGNPLWRISKNGGKDSSHKIDAAMAGALSWAARLDAVAAGAQESGGWIVD